MKLVYDLLLIKHIENANERRDPNHLSPLLFIKDCLTFSSCEATGKGTDGREKSLVRQRKPKPPPIVREKGPGISMIWPSLTWRCPGELYNVFLKWMQFTIDPAREVSMQLHGRPIKYIVLVFQLDRRTWWTWGLHVSFFFLPHSFVPKYPGLSSPPL